VPKQVSRAVGVKNLCGASLKFCQFPAQPAQFQKATLYLADVPEHQFGTVPAACAIINVVEHVLNDVFAGTEDFTDLAILEAACDQEHRPELHGRQDICESELLDGFSRVAGCY
jgi:hypothetical protein